MGKLLVAALIGLSVIGTELYSQATKEIPKTQAAEQNSVKLLLPPALYAVPGTELNVYFDNIVLVQDIKDWNFDVLTSDIEEGVYATSSIPVLVES